jgi:arylsulfatase A-like enzyme
MLAACVFSASIVSPACHPRGPAQIGAGEEPAEVEAGAGDEGARADPASREEESPPLPATSGGIPARPNIIVVMTDDQTQREMETPAMAQVRRLIVEKGTTFANSFVNLSQCCPSRATFLTGQYATNSGVRDNEPPAGGYESLAPTAGDTLPVWLGKAGYHTALIGKYLNGYGSPPRGFPAEQVPPGWDYWYATIGVEYYGYRVSKRVDTSRPKATVVKAGRGPGAHKTTAITRQTIRYLDSRKGKAEPFFLWLSYPAPHVGGSEKSIPVPEPGHDGAFAGTALPIPPSFNEEDLSDKAPAVQRRFRKLLTREEIGLLELHYRKRLESLLSVDDGVRRIVRRIEESERIASTVFIFVSDNGYLMGEHRIPLGKGPPYDESIRVPLSIRGPGIREGAVVEDLVTNADLTATIVELAGARSHVRRVMDGHSLVELLEDPSARLARTAVLIQGPDNVQRERAVYRGVRTNRYLYVRYTYPEPGEELFDMAADPYQLESRHAWPGYGAVLEDLRGKLSRLESCSGGLEGQTCWETSPEIEVNAPAAARPVPPVGEAGSGSRTIADLIRAFDSDD